MNVYEEVSAFFENFQGKKQVIGKSEGGRNLYAFFIGNEVGPVGISQAAIHGREYITALLSLKMIERGLKRGGFWVVPLLNPDGALLSEVGLSSAEEGRRQFLIDLNGGRDFSLWKANLNGVDLNVNFDARWGTGTQNVFSPAPQNYVGKAPFSESETRAIRDFTLKITPAITVSFHTKGEEIYWKFFQANREYLRDREIAKYFAKRLSLPLKDAFGSVGGYKDWCIEKLKIPALTVEVGRDSLRHPIKRSALNELSARYQDALKILSEGYFGGKIHARGAEARP